MAILYIFIITTAVFGFLIANYIHRHKLLPERKPLVCPLKFDCDQVIHSHYASFLGIEVTVFGMIYYGLVVIVYLLFLMMPVLALPMTVFYIKSATVLAFSFSLYLTAIQAFELKQWCSWCLISAALCTIIFLLAGLG